MQGENLALRRLSINNSPLYIPRKAVISIPQLIKSKYKTFIDTTGKVFEYRKQERVNLKYHKVKKVNETIKGCALVFETIDNPILVSCFNAYGIEYVGFLETKIGYIPYEYSEEYKPDTWRKI